MKFGVRSEDKSQWERRVPLVPQDAAALRLAGVDVVVQQSARRAFTEEEFRAAGVPVQEDLEDCGVVIGIKEIPPARLLPGKTYLFFPHVIKGQPANMPMLRRLMDLKATLIDYERIVDEHNRRLIFFGRHAGLAGMINTLWALGKRLESRGISSPFAPGEAGPELCRALRRPGRPAAGRGTHRGGRRPGGDPPARGRVHGVRERVRRRAGDPGHPADAIDRAGGGGRDRGRPDGVVERDLQGGAARERPGRAPGGRGGPSTSPTTTAAARAVTAACSAAMSTTCPCS